MNQNDNKKPQGGKNGSNMRGVFTLVAWALILTVLFSSAGTYMNQSMDASTQVEVDYSEFKAMVEEDLIERVEYDSESGLLMITPVEDYVYTDSEGTEHKAGSVEFYTHRWANDDSLIPLMDEHGVEYTQPHKAQMPMALSILLSYVVPFALIMLMFSLLSRIMAKRGGGIGGIGGVGKANAKVYVEKKTGVTFRDVAGQDEAKESLMEIIDILHNPQKYTEIGAKLPKGALL
ncbi:MAG: ATP-dependent metallopeptidase FtsH/Yme1/Tma family protein, partial [Oscillospiraceae bacterium]|nr:ATP-dependent metallopeptidase FtsH/Yme1/Tma family protein [Oscillospiraceae bacterium]